ncbi:MAG: sn-glycerol-3-phosphate ABC transporter ATP-binding protein UgpC [Candidatus Marinimicrobia bacterium]|nr:sn-glycerol-3-phosphate ABC transporter ATP-binding protein UgpC [Candidatus Neomarinimicrobiota bacterium]
MASVELHNVTKIFDNQVYAVNGAELTIQDEEFVVLVGPSGCGKSTLLRMIAGLEEVTLGEIRIDGTVVNDIPPKNRNIAMVFQNYALYPHMTVFENLSFGLRLRKYPKKDIRERVLEAAKILDITEYLERKPKALSGGQRQRVALGRALVRKPQVFLFDEPLSNLDAKLRVHMRVEINHLHQRLRSTMIYVTHDQIEAMTMSDKIVVLDKGVIQQVDSPLELYNNPTNKFVAGFIGSPAMNFIPGEIKANGEMKFQSRNFSITLPSKVQKELKDSATQKDVIFGIRPEHIVITPQADESQLSEGQEIIVDVVEPVGNEIFLYFTEGDIRYCLRTDPTHNYRPGDKLDVKFNLDKMYIFDAASDHRYV